jgi:2-methylisocitrate lyase-like PEP mutase family enzyme
VVYAPGLKDLDQIKAVVEAVGIPVNVLALRGGPAIDDLASVGVRRVSTGSLPAVAAYGVLKAAAAELLSDGTSTYGEGALSRDDLRAAFIAD